MGDVERRKVVCVKLGASIPLVYKWFKNYKVVGEETRIMFGHGDMYVMSEKAVGCDWKRKNIYTLRHAAGAEKYLVHKSEKVKKKPIKSETKSKKESKKPIKSETKSKKESKKPIKSETKNICEGTTKKGVRCKRVVKNGSFCYSHKNN